MKAGSYTLEIIANGNEITRLKSCIDETFNKSYAHRDDELAWKNACAEFHARYDGLAFPGGEATAYDRVEAGYPDAIEAALCFLECRPYFFRSGYIWKKLFRKIKHVELTEYQSNRLETIIDEWKSYRENRKVYPKCEP